MEVIYNNFQTKSEKSRKISNTNKRNRQSDNDDTSDESSDMENLKVLVNRSFIESDSEDQSFHFDMANGNGAEESNDATDDESDSSSGNDENVHISQTGDEQNGEIQKV